jgi:hypothetical protein
MSISANVSNQQITATVGETQIDVSVGETQIDVSVSGGVGPTGSAGSVGAQGPQGPQGATGPAGTTSWTGITDKPTTVAGFAITDAVTTSDSRLTDSREWSAATVTQAEAEAGTSTSRLAFSPLRVFQAVAAWWAASSAKTKLDGIATGATANATDAQLRDRATHTGLQLAATISDFTTAVVAAAPPTTDASLLTTGTLSASRLPDATTTTKGGVIVGSGLSVASGTVSVTYGASSGTACQGNDSRLSDSRSPTAHTHAASDITSGTIAIARLGTGSPSSANFLRGDGTFAVAGSSSASDLSSGTLAIGRLPARVRAAINVFNWSSFR